MPSGASIIIPAGPHQVTNIGDTDVEIIFLEPTPTLGIVGHSPAAAHFRIDDYVSPIDKCSSQYKVLAEDDDWFVGEMIMKAGEKDLPHSHLDHLCYVLEGDAIIIYHGKEQGDKKDQVNIQAGACLPSYCRKHWIAGSFSLN